jgi:hypothetical protein
VQLLNACRYQCSPATAVSTFAVCKLGRRGFPWSRVGRASVRRARRPVAELCVGVHIAVFIGAAAGVELSNLPATKGLCLASHGSQHRKFLPRAAAAQTDRNWSTIFAETLLVNGMCRLLICAGKNRVYLWMFKRKKCACFIWGIIHIQLRAVQTEATLSASLTVQQQTLC